MKEKKRMGRSVKKQVLSMLLAAVLALSACKSGENTDETRTRRRRKSATSSTVSTTVPPSTTKDTSQAVTSAKQPMREIADMDWASSHAPSFPVSTPEQFAGTVAYLNDNGCNDFVTIVLKSDLDLDDYEWEPLMDFAGNISGAGHTIYNIHLVSRSGNHNGLIGVNGGAIGIFRLNVVNAEVKGGNYAGILVGEGYMMNFEDVYASGQVHSDGEYVGALIGRCSPSMTYDSCSMDVVVNGKQAVFFSYTQENEFHADDFAEEIYTIELLDDNTVRRNKVNRKTWNLTWRVIYNDEIVLERNAEDEMEYKYFRNDPGTYQIYLTEYNSEFGGYVRVSNIVEYTV